MRLINLKRAFTFEVENWLFDIIPELTPYQRRKIRDEEHIRFSPFIFMKRRKRVDNIWIRLSVIFIPIPFILLVLGLPLNFFITGDWGYDQHIIGWFGKWLHACGIEG